MPKEAEHMMKNKLLVLILTVISVFSGSVLAQRNNFAPAARQTAALQTMSGETLDLSSLKGKVVVLAIGASWLPLSKQQIITVNKLAKKYPSNNVVVYWVSTDSANPKNVKNFASNEQISAFATKNKLTAPVLRDSEGASTLKRFGVDQLPSFVILDKTGKSVGTPFAGLSMDPESEADIFMQISGAVDKVM
jgi:thiol-disulfide isomerase/thioredoxin